MAAGDPIAPSTIGLEVRRLSGSLGAEVRGIALGRATTFVAAGMARMLASIDPAWAATLRLADPHALHRTAVGLCDGPPTSVADTLASISCPRTLLWGERTPLPDVVRRLVAAGVELRTIPTSGHVPMFDAPDEFAGALAELLAEVGASGECRSTTRTRRASR